MLGEEYEICSQGFGINKEIKMKGRYIDKLVDITIKHKGEVVAGIAVKFVMQNYSQNSNNYFENMLGETANIRSGGYPYFQIFVVLDKMPYYNQKGAISRWETFTDHNMSKYLVLSQDDTERYMHTPNKTLIFVVHLPKPLIELKQRADYLEYYSKLTPILTLSTNQYKTPGREVILNDYKSFMDKVYHSIMAL